MPGGWLPHLAAVAAFPVMAALAAAGACNQGSATPTAARLFADAPFYLERGEAEESFRGVLRRTPVREGPDTRDMPFALVTADERLAVYVSRAEDAELLRPFVDHEVEVIGKRIDWREEGFGVEVWIATISLREAGAEAQSTSTP